MVVTVAATFDIHYARAWLTTLYLVTMELSSAVISGVQAAGSSSVDEKAFQKLLTDGFGSVLEECSSSEGTTAYACHTPIELILYTENKSAPFKEALFGLCSLIIELARVDADGPTIR